MSGGAWKPGSFLAIQFEVRWIGIGIVDTLYTNVSTANAQMQSATATFKINEQKLTLAIVPSTL